MYLEAWPQSHLWKQAYRISDGARQLAIPRRRPGNRVQPITAYYARISAMRIVTAVTRPRMSASPG